MLGALIAFSLSAYAQDSAEKIYDYKVYAGGINAVDSTTLHHTAWFRDDFAGKNLEDLLTAIPNSVPNDNGIPIPKETKQIGLWVKLLDTNQTMGTRKLNLQIRIQDAYGDYHNMDVLLIARLKLLKNTFYHLTFLNILILSLKNNKTIYFYIF